ncbi:hypothetical protein ABG768_011796 [Culter alburnus]|uniref:Uncharacterized protein n=1 Tax=Culter alburnus TaxID=194366 RepID=A0AAW1Z809_CULAL
MHLLPVCSSLLAEVRPRQLFFGRFDIESVSEPVVRRPSDHSDWLLIGYCNLLVRKGISSYADAERTCYLAVDPGSSESSSPSVEDLTLLSLWYQREKTIHPAACWRGQAA